METPERQKGPIDYEREQLIRDTREPYLKLTKAGLRAEAEKYGWKWKSRMKKGEMQRNVLAKVLDGMGPCVVYDPAWYESDKPV